jgi:hypothetical protein
MKKKLIIVISVICSMITPQVFGQVLPSDFFINDGEKLWIQTGPLMCDYTIRDINFHKVGLENVEQLISMIVDTTQILYEHIPYTSSRLVTISTGVVSARYVEKIIDPSFSGLRIKTSDKGTNLTQNDLEEIALLYKQCWQRVKDLPKRKLRKTWKLHHPLSSSKYSWTTD